MAPVDDLNVVLCNIEGCDNTAVARGMCRAHYARFRRGTDLVKPLRPYAPGAICIVADCDRPNAGKGHCKMHGKRRQKHGDPLFVPKRSNNWKPMPGESNPNWKGDAIASYYGAHHRVEAQRGRAGNHSCARCGKQAQEWAYDHLDPAEKTDKTNHGYLAVYSADPNHYIPLCVTCHRSWDRFNTLTRRLDLE